MPRNWDEEIQRLSRFLDKRFDAMDMDYLQSLFETIFLQGGNCAYDEMNKVRRDFVREHSTLLNFKKKENK